VLRARFKIYLADAAIAPAVTLKAKGILEDPAALGVDTETAVFKQLVGRYCAHAERALHLRTGKEGPLGRPRGRSERPGDSLRAEAAERLVRAEDTSTS
jgi:hypothetical protein